MRPATTFAILVVLLLANTRAARAGDEAPDGAAERARIVALFEGVGGYERESMATLVALGPERVAPYLDLDALPTAAARSGAVAYAREHATGDVIVKLLVHALGQDDEELQIAAIQALEDATSGYERSLPWEQRWWRPLLLAFHATEVVETDTFYSGPGFPSWNLGGLLNDHVHGSEATLAALTKDEDPRVRMMAGGYLALTQTGRTAAVETALRACLRDPDSRVREQTLLGVGQGEWTTLARDVAARLADREEASAVRCYAAVALSDVAPDTCAPALQRALRDPDPAVRAAAAAASGPAVPWSDELAIALLDLFDDPDPGVRRKAHLLWNGSDLHGRDLPGLDRVLPGIEAALEDPDAEVRLHAVRALDYLGRLRARHVPVLLTILASRGDDPTRAASTVSAVAAALADLRGEAAAALPALEALHAPPRSPVQEAIARIRLAPLSREELATHLASGEELTRVDAVDEAARRGAKDLLVPRLEDASVAVALEAGRALVALTAADPDLDRRLARIALAGAEAGRSGEAGALLHAMGERALPSADLLVGTWRRAPTAGLFSAIDACDALRPALAAAVWPSLREVDSRQPALQRAARLLELLVPTLRKALAGDDLRDRRMAVAVLQEADTRRVQALLGEDLARLLETLPPLSPLHDKIQAMLPARETPPAYGYFPIR